MLNSIRRQLAAAFALLFLFPTLGMSFFPVDGWWYNPAESGRGFLLEMQDDEIFIAAFHYKPNGDPTWWTANGRYDDLTATMSSEFIEFRDGQCPGCPYLGRPTLDPNEGLPFTIEFHTAVNATLHWAGQSIPIRRMYWRFDLNDPNLFLFGEYHFTAGALGIYFGDRIYLNDRMISDGDEFIAGGVRGGGSNRIAVAFFDPQTFLFNILVDSSASYYKFFLFDMTKDRLEGSSWTFLKSEDPTGSGLPFIGHRVASKTFVQTGIGPHNTPSAASGDASSQAQAASAANALQAGLQLQVSQSDTGAGQLSGPAGEVPEYDDAWLSSQFNRLRQVLDANGASPLE